MRIFTFIGILALASVIIPQTALTKNERWCAIYNAGDGNGGVNCGFYTLQQCKDTIIGTDRCEFDYMYQRDQEQKKTAAPKKRRPQG
ncbi:MAG: hypothetical protein HY659_08805 [Rhizobiales bacterium]|nr:hypothetical protein [Hyphomicrobiales bacterium]